MNYLAILARWMFLSFLALFVLTLLAKFRARRIPLKGLLTHKRRQGVNHLSIGRLQLLIVTTGVSINFVRALVLNSTGSSMPDIPSVAIGILGASQLLYLAGKTRAKWLDDAPQISRKG